MSVAIQSCIQMTQRSYKLARMHCRSSSSVALIEWEFWDKHFFSEISYNGVLWNCFAWENSRAGKMFLKYFGCDLSFGWELYVKSKLTKFNMLYETIHYNLKTITKKDKIKILQNNGDTALTMRVNSRFWTKKTYLKYKQVKCTL